MVGKIHGFQKLFQDSPPILRQPCHVYLRHHFFVKGHVQTVQLPFCTSFAYKGESGLLQTQLLIRYIREVNCEENCVISLCP